MDFSINISNLFLKDIKVSIQKVIGLGWVWIQKGKLCGRTLKAFQVRNTPNLNNIFKSYKGFHDLKYLRNSSDYFEKLKKKTI